MLHDAPQQAFILPYHRPLREPLLQHQCRSGVRTYAPPLRTRHHMTPRLFSSFIARNTATSNRSRRPNTSESRIPTRASTIPGDSASTRTLFVVDARWVVVQALSKVSESSPVDEPYCLRRCASALLKFLKAYTGSNPVTVVLPHGNELSRMGRKSSTTHVPKVSPSTNFIPAVEEVCRALGVAVCADSTHDVREIIGGIVGKQTDVGIPVVIVSSDSDFFQLLECDRVTIMKPGTDGTFEHISEQLFIRTTHGLHPRQYVDLLSVVGKKGKFRGIPNIEDQLATLLVSHFGTVEDLIAAGKTTLKAGTSSSGQWDRKLLKHEVPDFLSFKTARSLVRHQKRLLKAKRLISINGSQYRGVGLSDLQRQPVNRSHLNDVLQRFEDVHRKQTSLQYLETTHIAQREQRVDAQNRSLTKVVTADGERLLRKAAVKGASPVSSSELRKADSAIFDEGRSDEDIEDILSTTGSSLGLLPVFGTDGTGRQLKGVVVGGRHGKTIFVGLHSSRYVPRSLVDALQSNSVEKRGCFLRELYKHLLTEYDVTMNGAFFDAHIALDLLNAEEKEIHELVAVTTGSRESNICELLSNRNGSIPEYSEERSLSLCCVLMQLISSLRDRLDEEGLLPLALRVEFPLIRVLGSMEIKGVPVDRSELARLRTRCSERLSKIEDEIKTLLAAHGSKSTNETVAATSVFENRVPRHNVTNRAKKNFAKPTASPCDLERMAPEDCLQNDSRVLENLFVQREELSKFIERDIDSLSRHLQNDGRVRATFVQGLSLTGRLATRNPNLQNIPVRSQLGRELRNAFRADDGACLLCADYSQIELRIVASLCGDPFMLDAFSSGVDIHRCIAGKIFDIPTTDITNIQRNQAKQVIYSILYGVSSMGLSERLGVPVREAENLLSEFKIEFPAVQRLANQLVEEASKTGYAKTLLGRRLPLPTLVRGDLSERRAAGRKAINMPIQGTQADMIKLSMVRIHERLQANMATSALVLQVHDELILEVTDSEIEEVISLVEEEMISALPLTGVDVAVQIRYGPSWSRCLQPISTR